MPAELEPPELAQLVDFAERSRVEDWSLRSALVRYAQPQPERVGRILDAVRRIEFVVHHDRKILERDGPIIWSVFESGATPDTGHAQLVGLLGAMHDLDGLSDALATWAVDRADPRPDDLVDEVMDRVVGQLDSLNLPREERVPGPRNRG